MVRLLSIPSGTWVFGWDKVRFFVGKGRRRCIFESERRVPSRSDITSLTAVTLAGRQVHDQELDRGRVLRVTALTGTDVFIIESIPLKSRLKIPSSAVQVRSQCWPTQRPVLSLPGRQGDAAAAAGPPAARGPGRPARDSCWRRRRRPAQPPCQRLSRRASEAACRLPARPGQPLRESRARGSRKPAGRPSP